MWLIEIINSLDSYRLDTDGGIHPRDFGRIWEIFTAPFLHASCDHLIANTIPFVFMGLIIALRGATRLALVTAIVIVIGGLGTWLIAPSGSVTVGASGVVFGYAAYLLTRGLFDRSALEIVTGAPRRRDLGRRAAREPGAAYGDLLAGAPVRRDRRRDRGLAAGRPSARARNARREPHLGARPGARAVVGSRRAVCSLRD